MRIAELPAPQPGENRFVAGDYLIVAQGSIVRAWYRPTATECNVRSGIGVDLIIERCWSDPFKTKTEDVECQPIV